MNKLMSKAVLYAKRNSSTILTVVGAVGVVATVVSAIKETPKALALLEEAKEEKGEELTKFEVVKTAAPAYIPTVLLGTGTIACIFGANILNKRKQAALMSAYALLDNTHKEYKKKVDELYGEAAGIRVREEIARDHYDEEEDKIVPQEDTELFYDYYSGRYFESTLYKVQRAEYQVNRLIAMQGYAYVNDFYEELGIDTIESGWEQGWSDGWIMDASWQNWLDFNHEKTVMDDGLECKIIVMSCEPLLDISHY